MKIAYIVLAHQLPNQFVRLVHRLQTDNAAFFIHIDKKTDRETYRKMISPLLHYENIYFIERLPRYYGDFNHLRATLNGIRQILDSGMHFDYVVLLTGQDYPIKNNRIIEKTLQEGGACSYMEYFKLPSEHWEGENGGIDRIKIGIYICLGQRSHLKNTIVILDSFLRRYGLPWLNSCICSENYPKIVSFMAAAHIGACHGNVSSI
jgi:Core-2/I-Branching enzyme